MGYTHIISRDAHELLLSVFPGAGGYDESSKPQRFLGFNSSLHCLGNFFFYDLDLFSPLI